MTNEFHLRMFDLRLENRVSEIPSDEVRQTFKKNGLKSIPGLRLDNNPCETSYLVDNLLIGVAEMSLAIVYGEDERSIKTKLARLAQRTGVYFC